MNYLRSSPAAKRADAQKSRSPSKDKPASDLQQSPKLGAEEGKGEDKTRCCKASSGATARPQQLTQAQAAAHRIAAQIAAAARPLSRERSARRAAGWEAQLRSPWISLPSQEMRDEKAISVEVPTGRFNRSNSLPVLDLSPRCCNGLPSARAPPQIAAQPSSARRTLPGGSRASKSPPKSTHKVGQASRCVVATVVGSGALVGEPQVRSTKCPTRSESPGQARLQTSKGVLSQDKVFCSSKITNDSPILDLRTMRQQCSGLPESPRLDACGQNKFKQEKPTVLRQSSLPFRMNRCGSAENQETLQSIARHDLTEVDANERQDNAMPALVQVSCCTEKLQEAAAVQIQEQKIESPRSPRLQQWSNSKSPRRDASPHATKTTPRSRSPKYEDPYRLRRFTMAQKAMHAEAVAQIRAGRKTSGWMWFEIPTPPHIVKGVERGSSDNRKYALRSDEEVLAFLQFQADGVDLRKNFLELLTAVRDQVRSGRHPTSLMGKLSAPKLVSSVRLFERVTRGGSDKELYTVLEELMELLMPAVHSVV